MQLIDTHCHLDVAEFDADREAVIAAARAAGVATIVIPGIHRAGWPALLDLCTRERGLHAALGLHPLLLDQHAPVDLAELERRLAAGGVVAVGEIGLDYIVDGIDRDRQQVLFEAQLAIARAARQPVILHVRRAHDPVLSALRRVGVVGGIAHAFNGSLEQARQYLDLGFQFGFGGTLTYERSTRIRTLARALPASAIVIETDAPDIPVASHRGERNCPAYLLEIITALASVRGELVADLAAQTSANARAVLGLA